MTSRLIAGLLCALLAGCGDSWPKVERKRLIEPGSADRGPSGADMDSTGPPHGEMHGSLHGEEGEPLPTGDMDLGDIRLTAPDTWVRKRPRFDFMLAEFTLPRADGDAADGRLTVSVVGGKLEENIDRWRQQFGDKPTESQQRAEIGGVRVTLVDFAGTYREDGGGHAAAAERLEYRLLGAIFEVGGQLCFVKSYGPAKTMAAHAEEFQAFVKSLKLKGR